MRERHVSIPSVVASLAPRSLEEARALVARVPPGVDAIEYRLDLSDEDIPPARLLELEARPVILTYRSLREGGRFAGPAGEYRRLVREAYGSGATVDVESASGLLDAREEFPDRSRVIASLHSPFALPDDAAGRIGAMLATGVRAAKLVAGSADLRSSLRIASLQRGQSPAAAVFPMGPASAPGRILSALWGSALVYGPIEGETAAGQIPIADLLEVYRVRERRPLEALFGIVGEYPLRSLSPSVHNALFRSRGLPWLYLPLPVSDFGREAPTALDSDPPFRGFSVTQPWKVDAARAGRASEDVRRIGAANTLVRDRGGWRADNTDVDGIFDPLADHDTGEGRTAVVLGTGGAARAAVVAARRLGYEVAVAGRRDDEADALADALGVDSMAWDDVGKSESDLYVNATPVGGRDEDPPAVPEAVLSPRPLVFDCVYRRDGRGTSTIRAARQAGCPTIDGLQMFAAQAVRQAELFGVSGVTLGEVRAILEGGGVA